MARSTSKKPGRRHAAAPARRAAAARRAAPARKSAPARRSWLRRLVGFAFVLLLIALLVVTGYLLWLDRTVTTTFEGRRWSVPAVVYAQPLELYAGETLSAGELAAELERVGYRASTNPRTAGTYHRAGNRLTARLRTFRFPDEVLPERRLEVAIADGRIDKLLIDGEDRALTRLDPPAIGSFFASHGEDRIVLPPEDVPELLVAGLKAVEDRNYDTHPGFDPLGIARALWANVRAGEITQGGSTITQQLVKSYFLDNRQTVTRKLREVAMAVILEARFTKEDLLNAYVNEIFLGQDGARAIHGFGLGAQFYFAKPLGELEAHEHATLLAIIRGPSYYNPFRHPDRVLERRNRILDIMFNDGLVDAAGTRTAKAAPLGVSKGARRGGSYYPAFMDLVRENLRTRYDRDQLGSEGLAVFTTLDPRLQESTAEAVLAALEGLERTRNLEPVSLQAAAIVSHTQTGEVLALVGGRDAGATGFNRALNAARPAGSLLKPVIYLTALEQGWHLASVIDDAPVSVDGPGGTTWQPSNFDGEVHGPVPLVRALADSLNLATVRLGLDVGLPAITSRLADLAGRTPANRYPSLLLGAEPMSPLDVTRLYGNFASGGFYMVPKAVTGVLGETGDLVATLPIEVKRTIDGAAATAIMGALEVAMREGTGASSRFARAGVAGKTGTSDDYRDSWFAGFDGTHLAVVWVGHDDNTPTGLSGATGALRVWDEIMLRARVEPLALPPAKRLVEIDYTTGLLAEEGCAERLVQIAVPEDATLQVTPGCDIRPPRQSLSDRFKSWFRD